MEIEEATCDNCRSWRKTGEVILYGIVRKEPERRKCKQDKICPEWTPFPQEREGSINETDT